MAGTIRAILCQTVKALKDTSHPYRQEIDVNFGGRVEVCTKQELLNGRNFNPTAVTEQLSVMVLCYDSFRGRGKERLKAYQENSSLAAFAKVLGAPEFPIEKADETTLFRIINQLNPLVIVDESHHARSDLSIKMLTNFNPCFVLDLTATPKKSSNSISYVDAVQLKSEHMVKLPVIVYNRDSRSEVLIDSIDLRNKPEEIAAAELKRPGSTFARLPCSKPSPRSTRTAPPLRSCETSRWHRNISRHGFCINGFINHCQDIMVMTNSGKIIFAETKGEHLKNDDSREKIALGKAWRNAAGSRYRYYMVFNDGENLLPGTVSVSRFIEIVAAL